MAFDQNSIPMDLRQLNISRTVAEDPRGSPVTTSGRNIEGFYVSPVAREAGSTGPTPPVYYTVSMSDAGFAGVGYSNAAPGMASWFPRVPAPVVNSSGVNSTAGHSYNPHHGVRVGGSSSDQASDEGGDDSVSGKKIKFLCSFGGKILPRPCDGTLRYVGGQTRIISVRRNVSFNELVQKMVNTYGQNVIIKYQLPDEDLDALVSVSCPDDLENMMDEYEKLLERMADGSAKLRVFLFSASDDDSAGVVQIGDLQDSGQRYVEAVNGIMDGVGGGNGTCIARKESIASAASTQNSDFSGNEAVDSSGHGQGDATGPPSTGILSPTVSQETAARLVCLDPNPAAYFDPSAASLGIPVTKSEPSPLHAQSEHDIERLASAVGQRQQLVYDLLQPGGTIPPPLPFMPAYVDPHQETLNLRDYVHFPSQMGFPTQLLGTVGPVFTQQHNAANVSNHQFIPTVQMTTTTPSHVSLRPSIVPPLVQPQQVRVECYPEDSTLGRRGLQLPGDQNYNAYQAHLPPVGGGYGWHQVPEPDHLAFSESWVPHQPVTVPEKIPRSEDYNSSQKELFHSHSDSISQGRKESPTGASSDANTAYSSFQSEDSIRGRPVNRAVVVGAVGECVEQQGAGLRPRVLGHLDREVGNPQSEGIVVAQNGEGQQGNDRNIIPKSAPPQGMVVPSGAVQSPYGVFMGAITQSGPEVPFQKVAMSTQYQVKRDVLMSKPINSDIYPVGNMSSQPSGHVVSESPKDYPGKAAGISYEDTVESAVVHNNLRQNDGRVEIFRIRPPDVLGNSEQIKSAVDNVKMEGVLENRHQQGAPKEMYVDNTFNNPKIFLDVNQIKPTEMLPCIPNEGPYRQNWLPMQSYEVAQPPCLGNPSFYPLSKPGANYSAPEEVSCGNSAFSGVDSAHLAERVLPIGNLKNNTSQFQPKLVPPDADCLLPDGKVPLSLSPSNPVGDMQHTSNSLFSNQDPWNLRHDSPFPPPIPNKILTTKEPLGPRDPIGDSHFGNKRGSSDDDSMGLMADLVLDDGVFQPSGSFNMNFGSEYVRPNKGSAEELIKQELQAVAEGVAASVLQASVPPNSDLTAHGRSDSSSGVNQNSEFLNTDAETKHIDKFEDMKTKLSDKTNFGFPVSDGIGRLQIIKNSDLEELQELGSGTFGTVYHGKWRGSDVAIKRINDRCFAGKPSEQERMRDDFWNEAIKLADLHHPNVVAFYGVVLDGPGGSVATVTEYMVNGSLRTALQKSERNLDKRKRLLIAMDVAFGMEYLHGKNIVHFDLKSDNLLVNLRDPHRPICKVGDLGLSKVKCQTLISGGVRGTLPWMAPELLNGSSSLVSEKVDVFSFGIVLWELLTGEEPYADLHYGAIIGGIVSNTLRPLVPESCDLEWRSLMEMCWSSEPAERPTFTEIANQLRLMAAKVPPKAQTEKQTSPTQGQVKN